MVADDRRSELPAAQQAALALADAFLIAPAEMSDDVRREVAAHLEPAQVVEVVLKIAGFSGDKVMVALGLDLEEIDPFELSI
jgi:alkylhydroperoxidase family enzyme